MVLGKQDQNATRTQCFWDITASRCFQWTKLGIYVFKSLSFSCVSLSLSVSPSLSLSLSLIHTHTRAHTPVYWKLWVHNHISNSSLISLFLIFSHLINPSAGKNSPIADTTTFIQCGCPLWHPHARQPLQNNTLLTLLRLWQPTYTSEILILYPHYVESCSVPPTNSWTKLSMTWCLITALCPWPPAF